MRKLLLFCALFIALSSCTPAAENSVSNQATPLPPSATPFRPSATVRPQPSATPNPLLQIPAEQLNGLQIHFWHPWSGSLAQALETVTHEFNETNAWGIQVITTPSGGTQALVESVEQAAGGQSLPDVVIAASEQLLNWQERYAIFANLSPYLVDAQWGFTAAEQADIPQAYWDQAALGGRQIGLPAVRDMHVLFYNATWAQELGFDTAPQTFKAFSTQVCAAAKERKDIDQTGGWIINTDPYATLSWLAAAGADDVFNAADQTYQFAAPAVQGALTDLKKLAVSECIWIPRLSDPYEYFASRQALLYSGKISDVIAQTRAMEKQGSQDEWVVLPYPSASDGGQVLVSGSSYAVVQSEPAQQLAAWLFLRYLSLPRSQAVLTRPTGYLPASQAAYAELGAFLAEYPQWAAARGWANQAQTAPVTGSWTAAQHLLQDAAWQIYQPFTTIESVPVLLRQLDEMIPEVVAEQTQQ